MKQGFFTVTENRKLAEGIYQMTLGGDSSAVTAPGQFINIRLDGLFLRRPISVHDAGEGYLTIIYKVVGKGTEQMRELEEGAVLDVLSGLGNGYDTSCSGNAPLLIGGGVGVPPLYLLAKKLIAEGKKPAVVLGFNRENEIFCEEKFRALGLEVTVATADGSRGVRGFVTDALPEHYDYFYTCGPEPMLKAVYRKTVSDGQLSFEERMGCGFGACMGCSCRTIAGYKRICKDGPVMRKGEIAWDD